MAKIECDSQPTQARRDDLGVTSRPIWTQEVSTFPWTYDEPETCYFLAGEVVVTCTNGTSGRGGQGRPGHLPRRPLLHLGGQAAGAQAPPLRGVTRGDHST